MQRLQYSLQLSCVPEEAACQNTHRAGALGKTLIKPSGSFWDLRPASGSASATANHYMEVKFTLTKDLSWHQRQISYEVFACKLGTQLQNSYWIPRLTEYQGPSSHKGMLREGLHLGNTSRNRKTWSKEIQQAEPSHTRRRERRDATPSSPEITMWTAGEWLIE